MYRKEQKIKRIYLIYDLSEELNGYVGFTLYSIERRLKTHIRNARRGVQFHISRALRKLNYQVGIKLLEVVPEGKLWQEAERRWIKQYREDGWNLWNMTPGGDGVVGVPLSEEHKRKIALYQKEKHVSLETREKISRANRGKKRTPEQIEHNRLVHMGYRWTEEAKKKLSKTLSGRKTHRRQKKEKPFQHLRPGKFVNSVKELGLKACFGMPLFS